MLKTSVLLFSFCSQPAVSLKTAANDSDPWELSIHIPANRVTRDEQHSCYAMKVPREGYVTAFRPTADKERVHHMLLVGCLKASRKDGDVWDCDRGSGPCSAGVTILYSWSRNAPALYLPDDVGLPIGFSGGVEYLVLQVHYAKKFDGNSKDYSGYTLNMIYEQPKGISAIYFFIAGIGGILPAHNESVLFNLSCPYNKDTELHPFAFRTHTHYLGVVVSAGRLRNGKWDLIGKRNPQWPQVYQKIAPEEQLVIKKGDLLAAQCRFNSTSRDTDTRIGKISTDEMCMFYIMYWRDANSQNPFDNPYANCGNGTDQREVFRVVEKGKWTEAGSLKFGQVSGLSFDKDGNIVVFHRGTRPWNGSTFTTHNVLQTREAIEVDTVITVDSSNGSFISSWGKNRFYVPHGITVDSFGRVWLTDVGLHQVLRFGLKEGVMTEERVWGTQFVPGNSRSQFCKPTSVAVASDGSFFVTDGYCNSRIVHFDKDGLYLNEYGTRSQGVNPSLGTYHNPHDIVLNENKNQLFVSDRENGRVQVLHTNGSAIYAKFIRSHILRASLDCRFVYVGEILASAGVLWKFQIGSDIAAVTPKSLVTPPKPIAKPESVEEQNQIVKPDASKSLLTPAPKRSSIRKLALNLAIGIGISAFFLYLICACVRFRKGSMRAKNMMSVYNGRLKDESFGSSKAPLLKAFARRRHKGFQLLSTEDIDATDDLTDENDTKSRYPRNGILWAREKFSIYQGIEPQTLGLPGPRAHHYTIDRSLKPF